MTKGERPMPSMTELETHVLHQAGTLRRAMQRLHELWHSHQDMRQQIQVISERIAKLEAKQEEQTYVNEMSARRYHKHLQDFHGWIENPATRPTKEKAQ
jgi:hypothetical protein